MAQHFGKTLNATLTYDARAGYRQAEMEGAALSGKLGPQAQILALSEQYKSLRAAGKLDEAAAIKRQANAIVQGER